MSKSLVWTVVITGVLGAREGALMEWLILLLIPVGILLTFAFYEWASALIQDFDGWWSNPATAALVTVWVLPGIAASLYFPVALLAAVKGWVLF